MGRVCGTLPVTWGDTPDGGQLGRGPRRLFRHADLKYPARVFQFTYARVVATPQLAALLDSCQLETYNSPHERAMDGARTEQLGWNADRTRMDLRWGANYRPLSRDQLMWREVCTWVSETRNRLGTRRREPWLAPR
jgi:hypothetical protein